MRLKTLVESKKSDIFAAAARYGDDDENSDIDFLVELEPDRSLLDLGGLLIELEEILGCSVDVVTVNGLKERIRAQVMSEVVSL